MKVGVAIAVLMWTRIAARDLYADSDGYYCVGPGYIAYQFGMAPPAEEPHVLTVVRFDSTGAFQPSIRVELPNFQVHGMKCGGDAIAVASFDSVYTVSLTNGIPGRPSATVHESGWQKEWTPTQLNLGRLSISRRSRRSEYVEVHRANGSVVRLEMEFEPDASDKCYARLTTKLSRFRGAARLHSQVLYDEKVMLECGHLLGSMAEWEPPPKRETHGR